MKQLVGIVALIMACTWLYAQDSTEAKPAPKLKLKKSLKQADKKLYNGDIYGAIDVLELVMAAKGDAYKAAWKLAETANLARDYVKAKQWYQYVAEKAVAEYPLAPYYLALMTKMQGDWFEAKKLFLDFAKQYKGEDDRYRRWAKIEAEGCDLAMEMESKPAKVDWMHPGDSINSAYSDVSPIMWNDSTMLFASVPSDTLMVYNPTDSNAVEPFMQFYLAERDSLTFGKARLFKQFSQSGSHVANGVFSPDRQRFYFTVCKETEYGKTKCEIYRSVKDEGEWQEAEPLGVEVNDPMYTSTQPAIGSYKNGSDLLYFVSDRQGGKGGMDIWYSIQSSKGDFQEPKNAGAKINTDRDEASPYFDVATGTLYFSSAGHAGFGGYDVFRSTGQLNKWTDPINMGFPINSSTDDLYYTFHKKTNGGFVVSNRPGVISIKSPTCCDDIFAFQNKKTLDIAVKGNIYDEALPQYPLNGAKVALLLTKYAGLDEDILVSEFTIANNEKYFFDLQPNASYKLVAYKESYLNAMEEFDTKDIKKSDTLSFDFRLKRIIKNKAYTLRNIYYDYNSAELNGPSKTSLDSLYKLMTENPGITVELSSHTDARGSDTYNLELSQQRANNCAAYLVAKGIAKERISAKGYGESDPLEDCTGQKDCADETVDCACHGKNRRTEFKIIGEKNVDILYKD
ncbi:MAG: OmpA family protein [Chitinophagales bacterium]|nr:OmpA family protein [Chitinophagales bacterium]